MDSIPFDGYASYSDSSTPRTPSPRTDIYPLHQHHKLLEPVRNIFADPPADDSGVAPEYYNYTFAPPTNRGSLLEELYDHDMAEQQQQQHHQQQQHQQHQHHHQQQQATFTHDGSYNNSADNWARTHDFAHPRRATFPYVRQDREDSGHHYPAFAHDATLNPYPARHEPLYSEPLSDSLHPDPFIPSMSSSPHDYNSDNSSIKLEDSTPIIVPSQTPFYRTSSSPCHPLQMTYLSPHTGLPTQYLRRRCFNCHTTEPPSWRRSTLNPGKIVCNKCGLYERTHLRPRPLRFDELRAGNKARKQSNATPPGPLPASNNGGKVQSPKAKLTPVKKEPRDFGLARRSSVSSSSSSSVHSGSGASDWDDNVSVYSTGSAPPTSFNSPNMPAYPLSRGSQSPPHDGSIRLPNAPLSDIASMQHPQQGPDYFGSVRAAEWQQQQQTLSPPAPAAEELAASS
ncbi:hypothetical protein BD779DRAFT_1608379 [Infundibulicybe gibba]|nr:hypothetical protein BD779DRAFT_1608379 [Infundibulicybe gibba]